MPTSFGINTRVLRTWGSDSDPDPVSVLTTGSSRLIPVEPSHLLPYPAGLGQLDRAFGPKLCQVLSC